MDNPEKLVTMCTQITRRRPSKQKHNTICVGYHHTQEENKQKYNTICVGYHHTQDTRHKRKTSKNTTQYVLDTTIHKTQDTRGRQAKQKTPHNMCLTQQCANEHK